jgi:hypothetical protein
VRRVKELMAWVRSGDYDRILGGEYPRRGEEPPPRQEAADAADHYAQRFKGLAKEAGEQLESAGKQLGEWLRAGGEKLRSKEDA